jgi:hypothetical protein
MFAFPCHQHNALRSRSQEKGGRGARLDLLWIRTPGEVQSVRKGRRRQCRTVVQRYRGGTGYL